MSSLSHVLFYASGVSYGSNTQNEGTVMSIVTLEELMADVSGVTVKRREELSQGEPVKAFDEDREFALVPSSANLSCRGLFDRWVPARSYELDGWVGFKRRAKAAWGVLTGRYSALDWSLTDDPQGAKK